MNLYGDHGNVLALVRRLEWRGIKAKVIPHNAGDSLPNNIDIIFGGGGQDSGQNKIEEDLLKISPKLKKLIEEETPCLVICGLYQLFGRSFKTSDGHMIRGANILNLETEASPERLIGNITISSDIFGEIVGYENHSGLTYLDNPEEAFGKVISGAGNNGKDQGEGCLYKNCIGTYEETVIDSHDLHILQRGDVNATLDSNVGKAIACGICRGCGAVFWISY